MLTRLGVGVNDGTSVEAAALRFRKGVTGKAGFLNSGASPLGVGAFVLVRGFLTPTASIAVFADLFFTSDKLSVTGVAMLALESLVDRRTDMLKHDLMFIH